MIRARFTCVNRAHTCLADKIRRRPAINIFHQMCVMGSKQISYLLYLLEAGKMHGKNMMSAARLLSVHIVNASIDAVRERLCEATLLLITALKRLREIPARYEGDISGSIADGLQCFNSLHRVSQVIDRAMNILAWECICGVCLLGKYRQPFVYLYGFNVNHVNSPPCCYCFACTNLSIDGEDFLSTLKG